MRDAVVVGWAPKISTTDKMEWYEMQDMTNASYFLAPLPCSYSLNVYVI